jgi:hypothetical protein
MDAEVVWNAVDIPKATKSQRMALYRLGMARSLVQKLDEQQADQAIKSLLALHAVAVDHRREKSNLVEPSAKI